uniref:Tropomodulin n=1 Tax=Ciona savignyi TaxID=51511 RepID=H2ZBV3_CIOSA
MLTLRPSLKKVKTREPKQLSEVLHGVCLKNVTSGAKKMADEQSQEILEDGYADSEYSDVVSADEEVANANDSLHRTLTSSKENSCRNNDVTEATSTTAGSTSTDSYDVIGELSINPNSVEETLLRIWENDEELVEVNLNNIQNVEMDIFEQLASAMEDNTHVKSLKLANTGLTDRAARALA